MPWDDDADDDLPGAGRPLPPDDRLWRHPSELGQQARHAEVAAVDATGGQAGRRSTAWASVAVAGVTGALLMFGVIAVTGAMPGRVVEHPVVEKVAMTPVVSSPLVRSERGVAAIAQRVGAAIVRLDIDIDSGDERRTSSGVIFRDDGLVLTSAHPLRGATAVTAVLADGRRVPGRVLGLDEPTDVAVVSIDADGLEVAVLGTARDLAVGDTTIVLGYPLGLRGGASATTGVVTALERMVATPDDTWLHGMVQTDAPVEPSCDGGALVDTSGSVIGITTTHAADADGDFGFATPIDLARRVAGQLVADGRAVHGWLGVAGSDLHGDEVETLGVAAGALVREVAPGSPAAQGGLVPGDVITELDGVAIGSMSALVVAIRDRQPGQAVEVVYWRAGERASTQVEPAERP